MERLIVDADVGEWPSCLIGKLSSKTLFVFHNRVDYENFSAAYPTANSILITGLLGLFPNEYDVGKMLNVLGAKISETIISIGRPLHNYESILSYGWKTISVTGTFPEGRCPDHLIDDVSELPDILDNPQEYGWLGELFFRRGPKPHHAYFYVEALDASLPNSNLYSLGRYFPKAHYKSQTDLLSNAITLNKSSGQKIRHSFDNAFAELFKIAIGYLAPSPDVILAVPPRANEENRFAPIIEKLCRDFNIVNCQELAENHSLASQKSTGNALERRANLSGKILYQGNLMNKSVIVIDDVATTKSTLITFAKALFDVGAKSVNCFVLGRNQRAVSYHLSNNHLKIVCSHCSKPLRLMFNSTNHSPFWMECPDCRDKDDVPAYYASLEKLTESMDSETYTSEDEENNAYWGLIF